MTNEWKRVPKQAVMAWFEALLWHLPRGTGEATENLRIVGLESKISSSRCDAQTRNTEPCCSPCAALLICGSYQMWYKEKLVVLGCGCHVRGGDCVVCCPLLVKSTEKTYWATLKLKPVKICVNIMIITSPHFCQAP